MYPRRSKITKKVISFRVPCSLLLRTLCGRPMSFHCEYQSTSRLQRESLLNVFVFRVSSSLSIAKYALFSERHLKLSKTRSAIQINIFMTNKINRINKEVFIYYTFAISENKNGNPTPRNVLFCKFYPTTSFHQNQNMWACIWNK